MNGNFGPRKPFGNRPFGRPMGYGPYGYGRGVSVPLPPGVGFVLFLIIGLIMAGIGGYFLYHNLAEVKWAVVNANVIDSQIIESYSDRGGLLYGSAVKYSFTYNGKEYTDLYNSASSSDYSGAARFVERHPAGSQFEIKVNPADAYDTMPKSDFLGENLLGLLLFGMGIIFVVGSFFIKNMPKPGQPQQPAGPQVMQ